MRKVIVAGSLLLSVSMKADVQYWSDTPVTSHWIGGERALDGNYACWTNPANWAEGVVPGRFVTCADNLGRLPTGVEIATNGCGGCIAVFDRACDYARVGLQGLISISNIVVKGSSVPEIIFGNTEQESPSLNIEFGGGIYVDADVEHAPLVYPQICTYRGNLTGTGTPLYICNDSKTEFVWSIFGGVIPQYSSWSGNLNLRMQGSGDVRKTAKIYYSNFQPVLSLAMNGGRFIEDCPSSLGGDTYLYIGIPETAPCTQKIVVNDGKLMVLSNGGAVIQARNDVSLEGAGKIRLSNDAAAIAAFSEKKVSVQCELTRSSGSKGVEIGSEGWSGTVSLSGMNTFSGPVMVRSGATLELMSFGNVGEPGPLGKADSLAIKGKAKVHYVGYGETVGHAIDMQDDGTLANDGGELVLSGGVSGTGNLTLSGTGDVVIASSVLSPLSLNRNVKVSVGDGKTVEFKSVVPNGYCMDVTMAGNGKLKMPSVASASIIDWVRVNGRLAIVDENGFVFSVNEKDAEVSIDAHGGKIPDAAGSLVSIDSANGDPNENVKLASSSVSVFAVRQNQSVDDAIVSMSKGDRLSVDIISVAEGAKPLVFNATGAATVQSAAADEVTVETANGSEVSFSGAVTVPFASLRGDGVVRIGEGSTVAHVRVDDPMSAVTLSSVEEETARLDQVSVVNGASLKISGGLLRQRDVDDAKVLENVNLVPSIIAGSNDVGSLRFESGSFTGRLVVSKGDKAKSRGAVYQSGGEIVNVTPKGEQNSQTVGVNGHGYYEITGGKFVAAGAWYVGASGYGIMAVHGGTVEQLSAKNGNLNIGAWEGTGVVDVRNGGKIIHTGRDLMMPYYGRYDANSVLTIGDDGLVDIGTQKYVIMAAGYALGNVYRHSVLNLNGGTLIGDTVGRHINYVTSPEGNSTDVRLIAKAFVNFDGGIFRKAYNSWGDMLGSQNGTILSPHRVTVYSRGATIDSNGMNFSIGSGAGASLTAPSGKGVVAIPLAKPIKGLVGSPYVDISGDGMGATAYAEFDSVSGTVTGIRVTSPGNDYTSAVATLKYGTETIATIDCELGVCASGGLTKIGAGTLIVKIANTYTGATVLKGGTLQLDDDNLIAPASKLVLDGGTLDMNGKKQVFSSVEVTENGGGIVNGTLTLSGLTVDFNDVLAGKSLVYDGAVDFAAGAKFTLLNADKVTKPSPFRYRLAEIKGGMSWDGFAVSDATFDSLPERWQIRREGNRILLCYPVGTVVTFR
ncbi:MAG: autotransporter-associated beta strand repeat-containing protein [Kiritimatiellae bacterium]|nr:autotransporter-associated beta strand repeat-containing protein [Kiritimatiellia bacterium]